MTIAIDEIKDGGRETIRLIVLDNVQPERKAFNRAVNEWIFKNRPDLQPSGINGRGFYAYQLLTTVQP